ncbi:MAG: squalene/phytoene synthase family protein [Acidobacteriota bacterium]|nr:squalene/phytoene synthase family protein [Acidobacteriota bacterium]
MPRRKRRAVYAAYAFCRFADDIVDEPNHASTLAEWQSELDRCYAGHPTHPITIALADALRFFQIPKSAFVALIDGCRQDLTKTRYENFDELLHYCELVAWSISDISLAIFGYRTPQAIEHGRNLATALQLTNVTRDIGDDLRRDRVYIPQDELRRFGVKTFEASDGMRRLIEFQIARAESYFRAAEPLLRELSFDARFPVVLMGGVYATVLGRLRRDPLIVLRERLSLTPLEKVGVVLARLLRPRFV